MSPRNLTNGDVQVAAVAVPGEPDSPLIQEPTYAETAIDGLLLISPKSVEDERGVVREFYRQSEWRSAGLPDLGPWQQLNLTYTRYGAVRAFHAEAMVKLIGVAAGEAFGAYVDLRPSSATAGAVVTTPLPLGTQVLVPRGVGNGFQSVTPEGTQYVCCFDEEWRSDMPGVAVTPLDAAPEFSDRSHWTRTTPRRCQGRMLLPLSCATF